MHVVGHLPAPLLPSSSPPSLLQPNGQGCRSGQDCRAEDRFAVATSMRGKHAVSVLVVRGTGYGTRGTGHREQGRDACRDTSRGYGLLDRVL